MVHPSTRAIRRTWGAHGKSAEAQSQASSKLRRMRGTHTRSPISLRTTLDREIEGHTPEPQSRRATWILRAGESGSRRVRRSPVEEAVALRASTPPISDIGY